MIVKLVAEPTPGQTVEQEIATLEREDRLSPAAGLSIADSKIILEGLQEQMVAAQVQQHNRSLQSRVLLSLREILWHEGLLPFHAVLGQWQCRHARAPGTGLLLHGRAAP